MLCNGMGVTQPGPHAQPTTAVSCADMLAAAIASVFQAKRRSQATGAEDAWSSDIAVITSQTLRHLAGVRDRLDDIARHDETALGQAAGVAHAAAQIASKLHDTAPVIMLARHLHHRWNLAVGMRLRSTPTVSA